MHDLSARPPCLCPLPLRLPPPPPLPAPVNERTLLHPALPLPRPVCLLTVQGACPFLLHPALPLPRPVCLLTVQGASPFLIHPALPHPPGLAPPPPCMPANSAGGLPRGSELHLSFTSLTPELSCTVDHLLCLAYPTRSTSRKDEVAEEVRQTIQHVRGGGRGHTACNQGGEGGEPCRPYSR